MNRCECDLRRKWRDHVVGYIAKEQAPFLAKPIDENIISLGSVCLKVINETTLTIAAKVILLDEDEMTAKFHHKTNATSPHMTTKSRHDEGGEDEGGEYILVCCFLFVIDWMHLFVSTCLTTCELP
jgi:hypothetical protein